MMTQQREAKRESAAPMPRPLALVSLTSLLSLMSFPLFAADIPGVGFRGDGSGKFPGATPPLEWSDTKNIKWRVEVGAAYSSPVVIGVPVETGGLGRTWWKGLVLGKVFVTSEPDVLICIDANDGKILWQASHGEKDLPADVYADVKEFSEAKTLCGYAAPTPASDGQSVVALFGTGLAACYSTDGKRKWLRHIKPAPSRYGYSASPVIADGKVLINVGVLTALDLANGKVLWTAPEAPMTFGTPAVTTVSGTRVAVTPLAQVVRILDGKLLARDIVADVGGDEYSISPLVEDGVAYFIDETATAVKLTLKDDAVHAEKLWQQDLGGQFFATPLCHDGLIFAIDKMAKYYVLDAKTGGKLLSKTLDLAPAGGASVTLSDAHVYPSVSLANGSIFLSNDKGETFVLAARKEYKEQARNTLPDGAGATAAFAGGTIFMRSGKFLYCFGR